MPDRLNLTVTVPVEDWSYVQRRASYLEALLVRAARDQGATEWWTADELIRLRLPGLPISAGGISRKASARHWRQRRDRDRDGRWRIRFHATSLPPRAFDELIGRILDLDAAPAEPGRPLPALPDPPLPVPILLPRNAAPAWVLPLMRLLKTEAEGDLGRAWSALPDRLPEGIAMPAIEEAAGVLIALGLVAG